MIACAVSTTVTISTASAEEGSPQPLALASVPAATSAAIASRAVTDDASMAVFLERLMLVESGGRDNAKNPRSTALGPFQFIETTFLDLTRRHFAAETKALTQAQVLALRTDRAFARRAAEVFVRECMAQLAAAEIPATFANLRLAYLVGPAGAVRLHRAEPTALVAAVLGAPVVQANPFMAGMTARGLIQWSERSIGGPGAPAGTVIAAAPGSAAAGYASRHAGPGAGAAGGSHLPIVPVKADAAAKPAKPQVKVLCNLALASCRKWLALAERQLAQRVAAARPAPRRGVR